MMWPSANAMAPPKAVRTSSFPPAKALEWGGAWSGVAPEGIEVKVVDEFGNEVPHGEQGEELSRGPHMFAGYLKNPEATASELSDDGWFSSGDLCYMEDEGRSA